MVNVARLNYHLDKRGVALPKKIVKRDGSVVDFTLSRIERALEYAFEAIDEAPVTSIPDLMQSIANAVAAKQKFTSQAPCVEDVQDIVEMALLGAGEFAAAKHYITYRERHNQDRVVVPADVREKFDDAKEFFPTALQQFMFFDKYSRYNWELGRRETWIETVDRVVHYLAKLSDYKLGNETYNRIHKAIREMDVMPSMRLLASAGPAAERNSTAIYNCSYLPIKDIQSFVEIMLISMAGCGVGISVERENVEQFPRIKRQYTGLWPTHAIEDSSDGWAEALRLGLEAWFRGFDIEFDYSLLRPAGAPLLTKGGRSSGPGPLREVLQFCRAKILSRQGTFLRTIDAHDIACAVGGAAVSGGVRRTAMISLFDYDDSEMRTCKDGAKLDANLVRWNANNSAVWPDELSQLELVDQMTEMYRNRRGEPGIFSRTNANSTAPDRRDFAEFGQNPCGEILLRPYQFCNLSIAVAREDDTVASLKEKVRFASIIGTIQSMATNFPGLRPEWKQNSEEERLLGVDVSGQYDCPILVNDMCGSVLNVLKNVALETNREYAALLGINASAAVTCNKPNGNSSLLLNCSSGIHRRWAPYYIRNVRVSAHTPIFRVLKDAGVPMDPENGQAAHDALTWVIHFPVKSPDGAPTRRGYSAIDQCEFWLRNKIHWTEHNPSVTITYEPEELLPLMSWVWEHRNVIGGMAFLPADDAQYSQMPYEEISREEYEKAAADFPETDFALISAYEQSDMTDAAQTLACMSGECEV